MADSESSVQAYELIVGGFVKEFNGNEQRDALERLQAAYRREKRLDASLTIEEWAKEVYTALGDNPDHETFKQLNKDRRTCLSLLYDLVRAWEKHHYAPEFENAIRDVFSVHRLQEILNICLPMDRAHALYKLLEGDGIGKPWFSELHLIHDPSYVQLYPGKYREWQEKIPRSCAQDPTFTPPMNKKLFRLIYSPSIGLYQNENIARWAEPKDVDEESPCMRGLPALSNRSRLVSVDTTRSVNSAASDASSPRALPEGKVALMRTDIQGSTHLWDEIREIMLQSLKKHNAIMRKTIGEYRGCVTKTEGDAFHVAFQEPEDAIACALQVQEELFNEKWSFRLLNYPEASDEDGFKGLRVRIAIGYGDVHCTETNHNRREYRGRAYHIAKALEDMAHGGQILVCGECWNAASHQATSFLGSPQVVDLGKHVLREGNHLSADMRQQDCIVSDVIQLVPSSLAKEVSITNDGHSSQRQVQQNPRRILRGALLSRIWTNNSKPGRLFPEPVTKKKLSPSYFDAPNDDGKVALLFINTSEIGNRFPGDDLRVDSVILPELSKVVESLVGSGPGYFCKDFMVAFPSENEAVKFGLSLQEHVSTASVGNAVLKDLLKVGIYYDTFDELAPDPMSGRADYQGPVANRAARVASTTVPGSVYLGSLEKRDPEKDPFEAEFVDKRDLKGVNVSMPLYMCNQKFHMSH